MFKANGVEQEIPIAREYGQGFWEVVVGKGGGDLVGDAFDAGALIVRCGDFFLPAAGAVIEVDGEIPILRNIGFAYLDLAYSVGVDPVNPMPISRSSRRSFLPFQCRHGRRRRWRT